MNKYASEYFGHIFRKLARQFSPEVLESMRRAMGDPSIGSAEQTAYRKAYESATKGVNTAPTILKPNVPQATPSALAAPSIKPSGAGAGVPPVAGNMAAPSNWSRLMMKGVPAKNLVAGGLAGAGIGLAADAVTPQFSGGGYWSEVGNQLRSYGIDTASSAAGAGIATGGAGLLPGAVWGAGSNLVGKLVDVGTGLNELYNPKSELNQGVAETRERNNRLDAQNALRNNPLPKPSSSGKLSDGQLANMAGVGFAGDLPQNAINNANQTTPLPPINPSTDTNNGPIPTPTPAVTPAGSVNNDLPAPVPSPVPSPVSVPSTAPSPAPIQTTPQVVDNKPSVAQDQVAKQQPANKPKTQQKVNPLKQVNFKPQVPNPVLKPTSVKPKAVVQNSRLGGPLGTVSNVFGRLGDTMQNAASGRLGKGDQLRQTSLLPGQNKRR
jgi:hypothetical protein